MALLEIKNLHVALEDGTEIVKGVDLAVDVGRDARDHGPERVGQVDARLRADGPPGVRDHRGRDPARRRATCSELEADERAQRGLFLAFQYPHAIPGVTVTSFLRSAINAQRKAANGGEDDPMPIPEFRTELLAAMERPEGAARARVALPQRRLLRRREEARRDPADGDAEAEDRRARRDRLRARHRRARRSSRTASTRSSGPQMGALVITHYQRILNYITPDFVHVFVDGRIVAVRRRRARAPARGGRLRGLHPRRRRRR